MIKVLYMNLLNMNSSQRRMDENIIRELVKISEVYVVSSPDWDNHIPGVKKRIFYEPKTLIRSENIGDYVKDIKNLLYAYSVKKKYGIDICLFASYNTIVFPIWKMITRNAIKSSYIIHNNNIDGTNKSRIKRLAFSLYSRKVNHIVLEDFIGEYLIQERGIPSSQVFCLPHPLNTVSCSQEKEYDCVGISNSNDEKWIYEIIETEKRLELLKKKECKVVLRSQKYTYDNKWLTVINGWLDDADYYNYINRSNSVFLPFPDTFQYRMSGSVVDAFSNHIIVIGSPIPLVYYYSKKYDKICYVARDAEEFFRILLSIKGSPSTINEFDKFIVSHSDKILLDSLKRIISNAEHSLHR